MEPTLTQANLLDGSWKKLCVGYPPEMKFGWLQIVHLTLDPYCGGRFSYMLQTMEVNDLLAEDIPEIRWTNEPNPKTAQHLKDCISAIADQPYDTLEGEDVVSYVNFLLDWLLWGFGNSNYLHMPPPDADDQQFWRLLDVFDLGLFLAAPHDYFGDLFVEIGIFAELDLLHYGNGLYAIGTFENKYPSPLGCEHRARILATDHVITGRLPLLLSNFSMRVIADSSHDPPLFRKTSFVNFAMYAPWVNRAFEGIEQNYTALGVYRGDEEEGLQIPQLESGFEIPTLDEAPEDVPFEFSIEFQEDEFQEESHSFPLEIDWEALPSNDSDLPALESA